MARNLLAETPMTAAFAHFPDDGFNTIRSEEVRPVFESLPADQQAWIREAVLKYDPRDGKTAPILAVEIGVQQSVAIGLCVLLHPDA
jgi:hypothetical protein